MTLFEEIPDLTAEQFSRFTELIHRKAFITMKDNKITLLSNRLRKRLRALGMKSFDDYYKFIVKDSQDSIDEMVHFLEAITTNESYFWRTTNNFDLLREFILPGLLEKFKGETLLFWSAGCSTGEEAYNLAIELTESMKRYGVFRFKIIASDISRRVVDFARNGVYSGRKIERIPSLILNRYFVKLRGDVESYSVRDDIRNRIDFRVENLFEADPGAVHSIFCRNVMIYFSKNDQEILTNHFYSQLKPNGSLVVGHSESLHMMNTPFKAIHKDSGVAYLRLEKQEK